jgi:hypothetical protein
MTTTTPTKSSFVSYASIVGPKKPKALYPITYIRKDIRPATTITKNLPPVIIMQEKPLSLAMAQRLFDTNGQVLSPLNTSGELQQYVVEDFKDFMVNVKHGNNKLKGDEKSKNCPDHKIGGASGGSGDSGGSGER